MMQSRSAIHIFFAVLISSLVSQTPLPAEDWVGFRGGPSRTGQIGDAPLPADMEIAWIFDASKHFKRPRLDSSPAILDGAVFIGLAQLTAFSTDGYLVCLDAATGKLRWKHKTGKPVFSSPAVVGGKVFIGEGYHQNSLCYLRCLDAQSGELNWKFQAKSHIESSPFVAGGRVFFGAGADGLYCLETKDGKLAWHFGKEHVDTAPLVTSGLVFCGIGYGKSSAICISARSGKQRWRTALDVPVWGPPVRVGGRVYFGLGNGNMVRADDNPRGAIVCLSAASGKLIWRRDLPDSVLSAPCHASGKLICTSRDGNVYAFHPASGDILWKRSLGAPILASPLVGQRTLIAVSDQGRVAKLSLDSGELLAAVELGAAELGKDGHCLSSPASDGHRVVFGAGNKVIALGRGSSTTGPKVASVPAVPPKPSSAPKKVTVNHKSRTITVDAVVCKTDVYAQLKGAVEYMLVSSGGKTYEAIFETASKPEEILRAFLELRLPPGRPADEDDGLPIGAPFRIWIETETEAGKTQRIPADQFVLHAKRKKALDPEAWVFTGSLSGIDPESGKTILQCLTTRHIVGLHFGDATPLLQNSREEARTENIYKANKQILPPDGTQVRIVFEEIVPTPPKGVKRVHVYVTGRVQGVGFRAYTQRTAKRLGLTGVVRNLDDGRVEAAVEGPSRKVDELLKKLERGPRAARVKAVDAVSIPARGDWKTFQIFR